MKQGGRMIVVPVDDLDALLKEASESPRRRAILNPFSEEDPINFFYNALMPDTYVRPHKHEDKDEYFQILKGEVLVVIFDDNGRIRQTGWLSLENAVSCKIKSGEWHTVVALEPSVIQEVKAGPYDPDTAKIFALWAPSEDNPASAQYRDDLVKTAS